MITLVAVHGNGGGGFRFARVAPFVDGDISFHAVTLPGFGGRPADHTLRTLPDYAEQLWREIADLPRPLVVLGHGIGGSIALDMVQRHEIDGLILHAPVGTRLERRWFPRLMRPEPVRALIKWGISSRITRPIIGRRFFSPSVPADYRDRFLDEYGRAEAFSQMFDVITAQWWDGLDAVDVPALILWGSDDRVLGADQVADYRALLPRTWVDVVEGWGHFPMVEGPEDYAATVGEWARRLVEHRVPSLRVGSGLLAAEGVGPKAALLDTAAGAGLPVPMATVIPPDAAAIVPAAVAAGGDVAVRSAFSSEDGTTTSNAGRFATELDVDAADPDAFAAAVDTVRDSADESVERRDVLVMAMVVARVAGVAFSEPGWQDDLVEWVEGTADGLVGGTRRGERLSLPRLQRGEHLDDADAAWQHRLAALLRAVRSVFGEPDDAPGWDIEWADDGTTCWLLQIRPITASPLRNEAFTIANHREILPDPPSAFMTSVIAEGSPELFDYYRRFDPTLPVHRHFIEVFDGRPLINLSLMVDFMRSLGLPTKLVTDSIGGSDDGGAGVRPRRVARRLPVLARLGAAQLQAVGFATHTTRRLAALTATPASSVSEAADRAVAAYVATVHAMTALNTAASLPTSVLRSLGVLEQHAARTQTAATEMFRDLNAVRLGDPSWDAWLAQYGHRGIYESDLARPRYVEDPSPIVAVLDLPMPPRSFPPRTTLGWLTTPVWWAARRPIVARETFRSDAMRAFLQIRRDLLRTAASAGVDADALWRLDVAEARQLDDGWTPDAGELARRAEDHRRRQRHPIPDVIHRFDSLDDRRSVVGADTLQGLGLVAAAAEGVAWVLDEPAYELPDGYDPGSTILIAPSVDPGWLTTFRRVCGVAIELGGDLSHGSIVLRELGVPSVTNVVGLTASIATGDRVAIDGRRGTVRRL
ncbi:MAG: alpha/beta fold hydrolase [Ilumatobacteraceae bacterium]|nr:alpha/beta fold hydrolase [Ilumatobacteraceae bacterium]